MLLDLKHLKTAPRDPARSTHSGQASWALPNTQDRCGHCLFWDNLGKPTPRQPYRLGGTVPAPRRCAKYTQLMRGEAGEPVPHDARACRYFQQSPTGRKVTNNEQ